MKKILLLLILFNGSVAMSQQEAIYTHYMYNVMAINPAYAGYENRMTATLLHRSQWVTIPGAPQFQTFSVQAPIGNNVGAGLSFVNDQIGPERNIAIKAYYSYTLRSDGDLKITFGLKAGLNMLQIGLTELELDNPHDPAFMNDIESAFLPNFGFGVFAYTENYYFGFSIPDLVTHDYLANTIFSSSSLALDSKKYYFIGGASFPLSERAVIKPSSFLSLSMLNEEARNLSIEGDISLLFIVDNKFAGGLMYGSNNTIAFLFSMVINKEIEFGYSYDIHHSGRTESYNGSSHEVVLKYSFKQKKKGRRKVLSCPTFQ